MLNKLVQKFKAIKFKIMKIYFMFQNFFNVSLINLNYNICIIDIYVQDNYSVH